MTYDPKAKIIKYIHGPCNMRVAHLLNLYLMNDSRYYHTSFLSAVDYAKKKLAKKQYDSVLFVQYIRLGIDSMLRDTRFRKEYFDLPENIDLSTRYHVANEIAMYIEYDYLNYTRRWK